MKVVERGKILLTAGYFRSGRRLHDRGVSTICPYRLSDAARLAA